MPGRVTQHALIRDYGEAALLVTIGAAVDDDVLAQVRTLAARVSAERATQPGLRQPVPGLTTLLVPFDPARLEVGQVRAFVREQLELSRLTTGPASDRGATIAIEVTYGGSDGPDLDEVAARSGLTPAEVVEAHAGATYVVQLLGFAPGFAYLGGLPEALHLPRRAEPRERIPAGSVAIAGPRSAVYPGGTAGGWHLIGRTAERMWDIQRQPPNRLAVGDRVRFLPHRGT